MSASDIRVRRQPRMSLRSSGLRHPRSSPNAKREPMDGVTIVTHPLVQHKLTLIRDKSRSTKGFRELLNEIGMLLCYEVTRDLPLTDVEIETPLTKMTG